MHLFHAEAAQPHIRSDSRWADRVRHMALDLIQGL
jgi:hypothetical protein